jgi:hypothetical protein
MRRSHLPDWGNINWIISHEDTKIFKSAVLKKESVSRSDFSDKWRCAHADFNLDPTS